MWSETHHVLVDKYEDLIFCYLYECKCDFWIEQKTDVLVFSIWFLFTERPLAPGWDYSFDRNLAVHTWSSRWFDSRIHLERNNYKLLGKSQALSRNTLQMTGWSIRLFPPVTTSVGSPTRLESTLPCFQKWLVLVTSKPQKYLICVRKWLWFGYE